MSDWGRGPSQDALASGRYGNNGNEQFVQAPALSLPKGGGAIRGIGEKFAANPVTGTGSFSVPIATSPGRSGFGPQLALSYDSGAGNGPFGLGWSLELPSITRKTDKGLPRYRDAEASDEFILSGAEDLVSVLIESDEGWVREDDKEELQARRVAGNSYRIERYRPRVEGLFARIERWTNLADPQESFWRSISRDNVTSWYGRSNESRICDPTDHTRIFAWLIGETYDDKGNVIVYGYKPEDSIGVDPSRAHEAHRNDRSANRYLKWVRYGYHDPYLPKVAEDGGWPSPSTDDRWFFEVVFDYGEYDEHDPTPNDGRSWSCREDPFSSYRAGFEIRTYRLCQRVLIFHHFPGEEAVGANCLVRSTDFTYRYEQDATDPRNPIHSVLTSVAQVGYRRRLDGGYAKEAPPPLEFEYSAARIAEEIHEVDPESLANLPYGLNLGPYRWVDLDGEGLSGVLVQHEGSWFYKPNLSPTSDGVSAVRFGPLAQVAQKPSLATTTGGSQQLLDLAGDGQLDLIDLEPPTAGFYERTHDRRWQSFIPFRSIPALDWADPNLKFVDLTGDGHADILISEDEAFCWHLSLAEAGFGPPERVVKAIDEEQGPRPVFADGAQSIHLADLSGDGLTDIVRIRNGEVCYWPNLGYGHFGAKVTMDNAPWFDAPDIFDQRRIRLADIDGSGVTDILYLSRDGVHLYFNQSGNSWSDRRTLSSFPPIDDLSTVTALDLLGNGTACLVWFSPLPGEAQRAIRYIDLMDGQKPHLLVKTRNNLGAETEIRYAPSTKFYLADKLAGKPWVTRLPFPVHVVEKTTVSDKWRQTRFASTYSYHHGYFDGPEREFRGFGRVEQVDVEAFGVFAAVNSDSLSIADDRTLYQPPVKTVTWFHTGAFSERARILAQFGDEYFPNWFEKLDPDRTNVLGAFRENELPEPDLHPEHLASEEWREAFRACKGMMLRQEVYELDADALERGEQRPVKLFSTVYHNCHIRRLQPRAVNRHAVFLVTESEAITYHYELDLGQHTLTPDPRIAHTLNLQVDHYGNVLQAVTAVYPRMGRHVDASLPPDTEDLIGHVQRDERHLAYTETRYTEDVSTPDSHRLRVPSEVLTYELTGISPEDEDDRRSDDSRDNLYFTLEELRRFRLSGEHQTVGDAVADLQYHELPDRDPAAPPQKRLVEHTRTVFFRDDLSGPLPFRELGTRVLPYESYQLASTDALLDAVLGDRLDVEVLGSLRDARKSGYLSGADLAARFPTEDTAGQYWIRSGVAGFADDAAQHFYLPERYTDPFGNTTTLRYHESDLYIQSSTDPVGNMVSVEAFDYRVLAPRALRDINDNLSEVRFDVLGRPTAMALKGKGSEGDSLDDLSPELIDPELDARILFFTGRPREPDPVPFNEGQARDLLGGATARYVYHFGEAHAADGSVVYVAHPPCAAAIMRERHVAALQDSEEESPLQVAFEYSDGTGAVFVKKVQAEPERAGDPLRWIASGLTVLNNKGKPVRQYEPYFSKNHLFQGPQAKGVTPVMFYDAPGRLVRTELPDGSFSRVEFSPWHVTTHDPNDTAYDPEGANHSDWYLRRIDPMHPRFAEFDTPENRRAAEMVRLHANTPSQVFLDSLGREVISVAHNKHERADGTLFEDKYPTFTKLDAEGKPLWIQDARQNLVMRYTVPAEPDANPIVGFHPTYDIAGNLLFQHSMDAGDRWMLPDATGQVFYAFDVNERILDDATEVLESRVFRTIYDDFRRPHEAQLRINGGDWQVVEAFTYRDSAPASETPDPEAAVLNLGGQIYRHWDQSGRVTNQRFDFKGNLLEAQRKLVTDHRASVIDWSTESPADPDEETFTHVIEYDVLNRVKRLYNWHRRLERVAVYEPHYSARGLLEREDLVLRAERRMVDGRHDYIGGTRTSPIVALSYDAKGQRQHIEYGNGAITRYDYDLETFRLKQLRTTRPDYDARFPEHRSGLRDERILQQLSYTYDPVGNITEIYDEAYEPVFFANQQVEPRSRYRYDSLYRLIEASGRENIGLSGPPPQFDPPPEERAFAMTDQALRNYTQTYVYDEAGNIKEMRHRARQEPPRADRGSWTRDYRYADDSNRLLRTWTGGDETTAVDYAYDRHGSMLNLARTSDDYRLRWDYRDMIRHVNLGGGGRAWYRYDAGKQRTRKVITNRDGTKKRWERLYLGGMEVFRRFDAENGVTEEIESHHLFAGDQRVLLIEDIIETDNPRLGTGALPRYQLGNHLGSPVIELDDSAQPITYEEYHPYGTTAFHSGRPGPSSLKRYRYTGVERDEETGLNYHTARNCACWLGRWTSSDPIGILGGTNTFTYAAENPLNLADKIGLDPFDRADELLESVENTIQGHGFLRGTFEAALAEAQGYGIARQPNRQERAARQGAREIMDHINQLELSVSAARNRLNEIGSFLQQLSRSDPDAHRQLSQVFSPLQQRLRGHTRLAEETLGVVEELRLHHSDRLRQMEHVRRGRTQSSLVSQQLAETGIPRPLIPGGVAPRGDQLTRQIGSLPLTEAEAAVPASVAREGLGELAQASRRAARLATQETIGNADAVARRLGRRVTRGVLHSIPYIGIGAGLLDAETAFAQDEPVRGTFTAIGTVVDPVDWAVLGWDFLHWYGVAAQEEVDRRCTTDQACRERAEERALRALDKF